MLKSSNKIYLAIFGAAFFSFLAVSPAQAFLPGEVKTFNVDAIYDAAGRTQSTATLRYVGDRAIFYTDNDWWNSLSPIDLATQKLAISNLLLEFDQTIYPKLTQTYGSEWSPGIDNDLRISILIMPMQKITGGYFNTVDEYTKKEIPRSNERELIYLNAAYLNTSAVKVFLAHEFTHMINFYQKEKLRNIVEDIWLNEARAEYAATLCGYDKIYEGSNLERRVVDFLRATTDSLTEWTNQPADYGTINLFMQYFAARYGEQVLTRAMKSDKVGIASLNESLAISGFTEKFSDIFTNWMVANYVNDCQLGQGQKFCYLNPLLDINHFRVSPLARNFLMVKNGMEFSFADAIKDWSGSWYEILPLGEGLNLKLTFAGSKLSNFQVPIVIYYKNSAKEIRFLKLNTQQIGQDLISNFGSEVKGVVLMAANGTKNASFSASEQTYDFSYTASITASSTLSAILEPVAGPVATTTLTVPVNNLPAARINYSDGSLLRAKNDARVYVVSGNYKRWIQSPAIFNAYSHFGWQNVITVSQAELDTFYDSWLIRAEGDARVYEINGDGTKHWLNMSADQFSISGRKWEMVYIVNRAERDLYRTGADVTK